VFIHSVEEVKQAWMHSGESPDPFILIAYTLLSIAYNKSYKFFAGVTKHSPAFLEYKIHNLSLTSDSRQDLQLNSKSIPSIHVDTRFSHQFRLPAHYTIL